MPYHHLALATHDMVATDIFYTRAMGFRLVKVERAGTPGRISFEDPDAIIAIETIGQRAGMSFWRRADLQRYPFLRVD